MHADLVGFSGFGEDAKQRVVAEAFLRRSRASAPGGRRGGGWSSFGARWDAGRGGHRSGPRVPGAARRPARCIPCSPCCSETDGKDGVGFGYLWRRAERRWFPCRGDERRAGADRPSRLQGRFNWSGELRQNAIILAPPRDAGQAGGLVYCCVLIGIQEKIHGFGGMIAVVG